jgi:hypothetical protein
MSLFCRLSRRHYWCVPHRSSDNRLIQVCYECGAERPVRELLDDFAAERLSHSLTSAGAHAVRLSERPSRTEQRVASGQNTRRLSLIK